MNLKNYHIRITYFILYLSLLFGFFLNEDFTIGSKVDYLVHLEIVKRFQNDFLHTLLNFSNKDLDFTTAHSPFFYITILFLKKFFLGNEFLIRFLNLHLSLLIPYIFYLLLKIEYNFKKNDLRFLIPGLFFLSPYFRSGSIWIGSENISLIFLFGSFYFFKIFISNENKKFYIIFLNIIFLSIAAYIRPIYSLFSIYFFIILFKDLMIIRKIFQYILINLILALPAYYYVFILDINFIAMHVNEPITVSRIINQFAITTSILFYYSIPFIIFSYNQLKKEMFKSKNYFLFLIYFISLLLFFDFSFNYGGGIFYKLSFILFSNNYLFYFVASLSLIFFKTVLMEHLDFKKNLNDLILFFILILLEIDTIVYHETYDLIFYLIFFTIAKSDYFINFIRNFNIKKLIFLYCFSLFFFLITVLKSFL